MATQEPPEVMYEVIVWEDGWVKSPQLLLYDDFCSACAEAERAAKLPGYLAASVYQDDGREYMHWVAGFGAQGYETRRPRR